MTNLTVEKIKDGDSEYFQITITPNNFSLHQDGNSQYLRIKLTDLELLKLIINLNQHIDIPPKTHLKLIESRED